MSVYLKDDMVLLDSGSVATSTDCCCGGCCYIRFTFTINHDPENICCPEENQTAGITSVLYSRCDDYVNEQHYINGVGGIDTGVAILLVTLKRNVPGSGYPVNHWMLEWLCQCCDPAGSDSGVIDLGSGSPFGTFTFNPDCCCTGNVMIDCGGDAIVGACCHGDGSCSVTTPTSCSFAEGEYQGDGTNCDPNPCTPFGVCCNGVNPCSFGTEADCISGGGTYQGDGTILSDICGACCLDEFTCADFWCQDFCEGFGGVSHPGESCGDVDCSI